MGQVLLGSRILPQALIVTIELAVTAPENRQIGLINMGKTEEIFPDSVPSPLDAQSEV
jgi:hypothetical protein